MKWNTWYTRTKNYKWKWKWHYSKINKT